MRVPKSVERLQSQSGPTRALILIAAMAASLISLIATSTSASATPYGCPQHYPGGYWSHSGANGHLFSYGPGGWCTQDAIGDELDWQADGNLVWYVNNHAVWSSNTYLRGKSLAFQTDGNVVVYANANNTAPIWSSGTYGSTNWNGQGFTANVDYSPKSCTPGSEGCGGGVGYYRTLDIVGWNGKRFHQDAMG